MTDRKHVHKVKRVVLGKNPKADGYLVYRCVDNCTSYFAPHMVTGLIVLCWACEAEFPFTMRNLRQVKPKCKACTGTKEEKSTASSEAADRILERLGFK